MFCCCMSLKITGRFSTCFFEPMKGFLKAKEIRMSIIYAIIMYRIRSIARPPIFSGDSSTSVSAKSRNGVG